MDASVLLVKAVGGGWDMSQLPRFQVGSMNTISSAEEVVKGGEAPEVESLGSIRSTSMPLSGSTRASAKR
jgi:hypothetical protein